MKNLNIEQLSKLLSNKIAANYAELHSYEIPDNNNDNSISNTVKENSYLAGFFQARKILFDYFISEEKYVEIGGEYTLEVGIINKMEVKVLNIFTNHVECKCFYGYGSEIINVGCNIFKMNGYKFK